MIFELVKLTIDVHGNLSIGSSKESSIVAYAFNNALVEISDNQLKAFMLKDEFTELDKYKYQSSLYYCISTNSLYINVMGWYRFINKIPLDTSDNFTYILSRVEIVVSDTQPEDAFAQYNHGHDGVKIWLTCAYAIHSNSSITGTVTQGSGGDKIRKFGHESSRIMMPSNTTASPITDISQVKRFMIESTSIRIANLYDKYVPYIPSVIFYIANTGTTITPFLAEQTFNSLDVDNITALFNKVNLGNLQVIHSNFSGIQKNTLIVCDMKAIISLDNGDVYVCGSLTFALGPPILDQKRTAKVNEFSSFSQFHSHLLSTYKSGDSLVFSRMYVSDYYSDKTCKNLIGIRSSILSYTASTPNTVKFLDDTYNGDLYQNKIVYIDTSSTPQIYVVNVVTDFKKVDLSGSSINLQVDCIIESMIINPDKPENTYYYNGSNSNGYDLYFVKSAKTWIPNTDSGRILKAFNEYRVYNTADSPSKRVCIYNGKKTISNLDFDQPDNVLCCGIGFDKKAFTPSPYLADPLKDYSRISLDAVNVDSAYKKKYLDVTDKDKYVNYSFVGRALPTTDNPPTSLDTIAYYQPYTYCKFKLT